MSSLLKLSLAKIVASLAGGVVGWVFVGPFLGLLNGETEWPTSKPMSWIFALVGVLLGGTLAGKKVGFLGWSFFIGTVGGMSLGILGKRLDDSKLAPPYILIGFITGLLLGFIVGVILEMKYGKHHSSNQQAS